MKLGVIIIMSLIGKNILITGATGFLGYHLTKRLIDENCNLILLGRNFKLIDSIKNQKSLIKIKGDLTKEDFLDAIFNKYHIDMIFHLAAKVHDRSEANYNQYKSLNVILTKKIAELALQYQVKKIIFFSTVSVYGDTEGKIIDEKMPCFPSTVYSKTKLEAEKILLKSWQDFKLPVVILRLSSIYGKYDHGNLPLLYKAIKKHLSFMVGKGKNRKTMLHTNDAIQAAMLAVVEDKANGEVFNIGEDFYRFCDILNMIEKTLGVSTIRLSIPLSLAKIIKKRKLIKTLSRMIETISSDNCYSSDKAKKILNFNPLFNLEQGLQESVEWYKDNF